MPKGLNRFGELKSLAGSLNELSPPTDTPEGDLIACLNMRPSRDGISREKRKGYTKFDNFYDFNEEMLVDGGLESWKSETDLTYWEEYISGGSTVNKEVVYGFPGDYACRLDVDALGSEVYIHQTLSLLPNKNCEFSLFYHNSTTGKTARIKIQDLEGNVSLKSDGTWGAGPNNYISLPNSVNHIQFVIPFISHALYTSYKVILSGYGCLSSSVFLDEVSLKKRAVIRGFFDYWDESGINRYVVVTRKKIFTRAISDEEWFEIYSQTNEIAFPIKPVAYLRERPIIVGFDNNLLIEPSTVYGLGIVAPLTAPTLAEGAAGNLTGIFKYVITYMRSGNFQVESNPSPISSPLTVGIVKSTYRSRSSNVATIKTNIPHGFAVNDEVIITDMGGTGYNGAATVVSVPDTTGFTYANTGSNEAETIDTGGTIGRVRSAHRARASNVATIGTSSPHGLAVGNEVVVTGMGGTGYNGTWLVVSVPDSTHFTYANIGSNETEAADTGAAITYKKKINLSNIPVSSDPKVDKKRIYRTQAGGQIFFWLVDIDNATTTYEDSLTALGDEVSYDRYPPPVSIFAEVWDDRVWFVPKDYRNQLHFTNKGSAEEMAYDNIVQVKGKDSDEVMGIKAYMGSLYVLKHKKPFRIDKVGESSYELTELPFKTGTDCPASITVVGGFLMWYSKRGLEIFKEKELVDPPISDLIPITIGSINQDAVSKSFGNEFERRNEYWLSVPVGTSTEPNKVIVLDYIRAKITPFEFSEGITCMHNIRSGTAELQFITGSPNGNLFVQDSGYTDDGVQVESHFMTKHYRCLTGEKGVWNTLRRMWTEYICPLGSKVVLNIYPNKKKFPIASIELEGMSPTDLDEKRSVIGRLIKLGISCAYFCLEFVHNEEANGTVRILPPEIYFKNKVWKRDIEAD